MWIWPWIALFIYLISLEVDNLPIKIGLVAAAYFAYRYWDNSRTCKHCKRKAHK